MQRTFAVANPSPINQLLVTRYIFNSTSNKLSHITTLNVKMIKWRLAFKYFREMGN